MELAASPGTALSGTISVPGDKSISHRALILGASAVGQTTIRGLLEGEDVLATAAALRALGARIERDSDGLWRVEGRGPGGLLSPDQPLDLGNSGTGVRLLMGLVASQPVIATFCGDASLSRRPMGRVATPLRQIGARLSGRAGDLLPMVVEGSQDPVPIEYELPVASAQVKSAILLAALNIPGRTTIIEPEPTRDHTERMLRHFGAKIEVEPTEDGGRRIAVEGEVELASRALQVPGDPSSAAFPVVAALVSPGSKITVAGVGANPLRLGLFQTLIEMGADIVFANERSESGEPIVDISIRAGRLRGVDVPARRAPAMIDEYPILAVAAACAYGTTTFRGIGELRVKESDRLTAIAAGLAACGIRAEAEADSLIIHGCGGPPPGGARIETHYDHRIAMAFLILGQVAAAPVTIDDDAAIATSFPDFVSLMRRLGAAIGAPADTP